MVGADFKRMLRVIVESLRQTGQRALLSSGWGNLGGYDLPGSIMQIGSVPHEWLFPQMLAVSHHGGAGTTAAGARAGVPSIIVPFGGDQPYWGNRVYQTGIGPKPIWCKKLSVENYRRALNEVAANQEMRNRAAFIGTELKKENGVANAVAIIEKSLR
jgi:sterol 3beta-glucosyltransferase